MTITITQETSLIATIETSQENISEESSSLSEMSVELVKPQQEALLQELSGLCLSVIAKTETSLPESPSPSLPFLQNGNQLAKQEIKKFASSQAPETQTSCEGKEMSSLPNVKSLSQTTFSHETIPDSPIQGRVHIASQQTTSLQSTLLNITLPNLRHIQTYPTTSQKEDSASTLSITVFNKGNHTTSSKKASASPLTSSSELSPLPRKESSSSRTLLSPMALFETATHQGIFIREGHTQDGEDPLQEGDHDHNHDQDHSDQEQENEELSIVIKSLSKAKKHQDLPFCPEFLPKEIQKFALSEAQLSQLLHIRLNYLDILRICAEIMKLMLNSREQDLLERRSTREHFMREAKNIADSFAKQSQITKWLGITTATLGIFGAISPIMGEVGGEGLLNIIRKATGSWQQASSKTFFEGMGKVCSSLSELAKVSSTVYDLRSNAVRTIAESYKEIFRLEHDEMLRSIEELKDHWRNMDSFLLQILQTQHDAVRSLYQ